jgi:signal transduction histidine kinase
LTARIRPHNIGFMSFRRRIFLILFAVGILPSGIILAVSIALLNSTLGRLGAENLERSLQSAASLLEETQAEIGRFLEGVLEDKRIPWEGPERLREWMEQERVDLVFRVEGDSVAWTVVDSLESDTLVAIESWPDSPGLSGIGFGSRTFLSYSLQDSAGLTGCGVLMPAGYESQGRIFSDAVAASAGMGILKSFALKLLGVASLAMIVMILMAALAISTITSRRLTEPLQKLTEGARRIGAGDLEYRVDIPGRDEFSRLAGSFNRMGQEIRENQRKLVEAERLAAWREVARRIAHEIRNPLTPVKIELYRLQKMIAESGGDRSHDAAASVEAISAQIQMLEEMAGQFSTFAREPELKRAGCSIKDIIEKTVALYDKNENVSFKLSIPDNIPVLDLDFQMMGRVFGNLFKNSMEAFPEGVGIEVKVEVRGEMIEIVVRDNGPGFPLEKLEMIDRPYVTTKKSGTGLGLAIVKKIIEEHGGKIRFYNDGGAVVEMALPIKL